MSGIFISYRRDGGLETAKHLALRLETEGYKVFFDITSMRVGPFDEQLYRKIDKCSDFIIILDTNVFKRTIDNGLQIKEDDWLAKELAYAYNTGKNIISIELPGYSKPEKDKLPEEIRKILLNHNLTYTTIHFEKSFYSKLTESLKTPNPIKSKVSKYTIPFLLLVFAYLLGYRSFDSCNEQFPPVLNDTTPIVDTTPILVIMGGGSVWNYINMKTKFDSLPKDSLRNYRYIYLPMASTVAWSQIRELRSVPTTDPNNYLYQLVLLSAKKAEPQKMIPEDGQGKFRTERGYVEEIYIGKSHLQVAFKKDINVNDYIEVINGDTVIPVNKLVKFLSSPLDNLIVYTTNEGSGTFLMYNTVFKDYSFGMDSISNREPFVHGQQAPDYSITKPYIILGADTYFGKHAENYVRRCYVYDEKIKQLICNDLYIYFVVFKQNDDKFVIPKIVRNYLLDIGIIMPENGTEDLNGNDQNGLILKKEPKENSFLQPIE